PYDLQGAACPAVVGAPEPALPAVPPLWGGPPAGPLAGLDADSVARRLGELAARLVLAHGAAGVVATGGDGASAVLAALQASGIALVDEVTGGVPLGTLTGGQAAGLPVVTKAGGFGEQDVLIRAAQAIRERRFTK
ncbi:D-threonate kinase, partial [Bordetella bronchiseptica]